MTQGQAKRDREKVSNPADELMWMSFETRMRGIVQGLLEPAHDTSRADREGMINLDLKFWGLDDRLARIEEAIFNVAKKRQRRLSMVEGDHEEK